MYRKLSQLWNSGLKLDSYSIVQLTRSCSEAGLFSHGEQLHCLALKTGFASDTFVSTSLVNFYVKVEHVQVAHHLFVEIPEPSLVSWNSMISGYVRSGEFRKGLKLFLELERSNLSADSYSFTAALSACAQLSLIQFGKSLHAKIVKYGDEGSVYVCNCLIDMYGKCGFVAEVMAVFQNVVEKDTISWNTVIGANARNGKLEQAFALLHQMPEPDTISYNQVIDGVARFGVVEDAISVLSYMPNPNASSWNSVITGYVNRGRVREAFRFLCKMHLNAVRMDQFTFSVILSGMANLSAVTWGISIHCSALKCGLDECVVVGSALIDMYFKCGRIDEAERLFLTLPKKNLVTWNAVISGYAHNGNYTKVIQLFELLRTMKNIQPDEITFLNVLSACWYNKIPLKVADRYFRMMINDYLIDPTPEHCTLMIKLLGEEKEVQKAEKMIHELGFVQCGAVWKALLCACVGCGNVELAELASEKIIKLENDDSEFVYVMMSNIYANHGNWDYVGRIRELMKERMVWKEAGCSRIEVGDITP